MNAYIPEPFKPLFTNDYLYYVFYGGRGSGKTENIAQYLILESLMNKHRILCIRESQKSLSDSVKATLEKWINELDLLEHFEITKSTLRGKNGTEFIFTGMQEHNSVNVKSLQGITITWIEEASAFSKFSWELLVPSVTRVEKPKIIISFNPHRDDDIIYKEFVSGTPPANSYIKKLNYDENPFFKGSVLEQVMKDDKQRIPAWEFNHKWLGELARHTEESLFYNANKEPLNREFVRSDYIKIVIACDPATTNDKFSNEFGISVLGKTADGIIVILDDLSGNMGPLDFSLQVKKLWHQYEADEVVVETNNGGDFIKATILQVEPLALVKEVRATADKMQRALPVANLMSINKVRLNKPLQKLERQMDLMTSSGFKGSIGESPDRLDAMVWGVYRLANIRDKDAIHSVFNPDEFNNDKEFLRKCLVAMKDVLYSALIDDTFYCLEFDVLRVVGDFRLKIKKSYCLNYADYEKLINDRKGYRNLLRDTGAVRTYTTNLSVMTYEGLKEKELDKKVLNILPFIKQSKVYFDEDMPEMYYNNNKGKLIMLDLAEYKYDSDAKYPFVELLCDVIYNEYEINKEK